MHSSSSKKASNQGPINHPIFATVRFRSIELLARSAEAHTTIATILFCCNLDLLNCASISMISDFLEQHSIVFVLLMTICSFDQAKDHSKHGHKNASIDRKTGSLWQITFPCLGCALHRSVSFTSFPAFNKLFALKSTASDMSQYYQHLIF